MPWTEQSFNKFLIWFSLAAAVITLGFSALNAYGFPAIVIRAILAYAFIYVLGKGLCALWKKFTPPPPAEEDDRSSKIDIILGEINGPESERHHDSQEKPQNSRSSNNTNTAYPGQINNAVIDGLTDNAVKAEIVRKMGWGDNDEGGVTLDVSRTIHNE